MFLYPVKILSQTDPLYFSELKYQDYKNIVKTITNNDNELLNHHFNHVIRKHSNSVLPELNIIDKAIILISIRSYCIDTDIKFQFNDPEKKHPVTINIYLGDLVDILLKCQYKSSFFTKIGNNDAKVTLPSELYYRDHSELYLNCIEINGTKLNTIKGLTLPYICIKDVVNFVKQWDSELTKQSLFSYDLISNKKFFLSCSDNTLFELIKHIFNNDFNEFFTLEQKLIKYGFSYNDLKEFTYAELQVHLSIIEKSKNSSNSQDQLLLG